MTLWWLCWWLWCWWEWDVDDDYGDETDDKIWYDMMIWWRDEEYHNVNDYDVMFIAGEVRWWLWW